MVRKIRKRWRRFYRNHREGCDAVADFLGALSIFVFIFSLYIFGALFFG